MRSLVIVALQIALIVVIALPFGGSRWGPTAGALVGLGIAIGVWALTANRPGNFRIRPEPKPGGRLVTAGPYAYVRHPMYLAVLVATLGFCIGYGTTWRWLAFAALGVVLAIKMDIEETALAARHPEYAAYARRTKRVVPFVW